MDRRNSLHGSIFSLFHSFLISISHSFLIFFSYLIISFFISHSFLSWHCVHISYSVFSFALSLSNSFLMSLLSSLLFLSLPVIAVSLRFIYYLLLFFPDPFLHSSSIHFISSLSPLLCSLDYHSFLLV